MTAALPAVRPRRWFWWGGLGLLLVAFLILLAWVTGAFATADVAGTCYRYDDPATADGSPAVPCSEPHTAQAVAFLPPALDDAEHLTSCQAAVSTWLAADARQSQARIAFRTLVVPIQAAWRHSGARCDVVRADYPGPGSAWVLAPMVDSVEGALADDPSTWVQCRRLEEGRESASSNCRPSGKKGVSFAFSVTTKGGYAKDKAKKAALKACRAAAEGEVPKQAKPVRITTLHADDWTSGDSSRGRCVFTTKAWTFATE